MSTYKFDSEFIESTVLHVTCEDEHDDTVGYDILINTWDDPYKIYYDSGHCPDSDHDTEFKDALFGYLREKYPEHF